LTGALERTGETGFYTFFFPFFSRVSIKRTVSPPPRRKPGRKQQKGNKAVDKNRKNRYSGDDIPL
jgi:hypothetical protein